MRLWNPTTGKYVYFDDCRRRDGTMVDAKGTGYLAMLEKNSDHPWAGVEAKLLKQAEAQLQAAQGRPIEWHVAEARVTQHMRELFKNKGWPITVIHSPPPGFHR